MSIPIIALGCAAQVLHLWKDGVGDLTVTTMGVGFLVSALCGFFAIDVLIKIIKKWSYLPFVIYRIIMGILILVFLV